MRLTGLLLHRCPHARSDGGLSQARINPAIGGARGAWAVGRRLRRRVGETAGIRRGRRDALKSVAREPIYPCALPVLRAKNSCYPAVAARYCTAASGRRGPTTEAG